MKFYILLKGEPKGPFPWAMVCEMLQAGAIHEMTLVAPEGGMEWRPYGSFISELSSVSKIGSITGLNQPTKNLTTILKLLAARQARVAVVVILCLGAWIYFGMSKPDTQDQGSSKTQGGLDSHRESSITSKDNGYRAQNSLRAQVREILSQRYRGQPELQNDIENGVMSLSEVYTDLSAAALVRKFESLATGS